MRDRVFKRDGKRCVDCGAEEPLTLYDKGSGGGVGGGDISNWQTLCERCNVRKRKGERLSPRAPTAERLEHDPHEIGPSPLGGKRVWRVIDTVDLMARRGSLGPAQVSVARRFQEDFADAGLDPLRVRPLERIDGGHQEPERALAARERIGRAMRKLGGHGSLLAQVVWYVLGAGATFAECARRLQWSGGTLYRNTLAGVLIAALDLLTR